MIVIQSMQDAIEKAAKTRYGAETEIRAEINPRSGELKLTRLREVVEAVEEPAKQISLTEAVARNGAAKLGDYVGEPLPPIEFGRIAAQSAKQVIVQKVRDAERERMYDEYINRVGEIVNGTVMRVEYGNVIGDLGRGEAIIRRDELIPREMYRYGDRVRAYIYDVRREQRGPQIFLSRTHPQFMAKLFMQEVPEIYDGIITIRSIARDPGSRAKIAVTSNDSSIDPVGASVGMRGSRVQAVVGEQLSLAIGRRGQNVRLASQLIGWDIDILTEQEESERRQKEFTERSALFMQALDVDEMVAQLLASEGFSSVEQLAYIDVSEIASIQGFDEETASEIQTRATEYLAAIEKANDEERIKLGVADDLYEINGLNAAKLVALGKDDIKTVEDFAGCAADDLVGWTERKDGEVKRFDGTFKEI